MQWENETADSISQTGKMVVRQLIVHVLMSYREDENERVDSIKYG